MSEIDVPCVTRTYMTILCQACLVSRNGTLFHPDAVPKRENQK